MPVASDKIMSSNLLQEQSKELITLHVDALALLGKATADLNQFQRNNLRSRLPDKMRPLATNVPAVSQWLFGDDLNKRIAQISSMNNGLSQILKSNNQQGWYNHSSASTYYQYQRSKNYQPSWRSSALRKKGQRQSNFARTKCKYKYIMHLCCW